MKSDTQIHGSIPYDHLRRLGIDPVAVLDFSATVNPHPLPVCIRELISADNIESYPDSGCHEAVSALAEYHGVPPEWVTVTTGTTEAIFALPAMCGPAVQLAPTYGDYAAACRRSERNIVSLPYPTPNAALGKTIDTLRQHPFGLLFVCTPNNPDGRVVPVDGIRELCEAFPNVTVCVDESYQEMGHDSESAVPLLSRYPHLLIVKSLTKPFGIGGLRAGYVLSSGPILRTLRSRLLPWGVSAIAQRVIPALLANRPHFEPQWRELHAWREQLRRQVEALGIRSTAGACPFFLADVTDASALRVHLLHEHHIAIRDCTSFGLPRMVRIMPSFPHRNAALVRALEAWGAAGTR